MLDNRPCDYVIPQQFLVIRNLHHNGVLKMDMLQACKAKIDLRENTLHLFDDLIIAPLTTNRENASALYLMQCVRIPARSEAILLVTLFRQTTYDFRSPATTEAWPTLQQRFIGVAKALVQPQTRRTLCRIINVKDTPQVLRRGTKIACLSTIDMPDPFNVAALNGTQNRN
jgi:hypothetical protein